MKEIELIDNILGIQHIGISTDNMDETIKFYIDIGFTVVLRTETKKNSNPVVFLRQKLLFFEIYHSSNDSERAGAIDHLSIDTSDINQTFEIIKQKGFKRLDDEIQYLPFWENGVRFFTIEGPNSEKIEFCQRL
jgi:lactoylglutathione lyase